GAGPCAQSTTGSEPAGQRIAGRSPPGPFRCGSTTCSVKPAATAASNALPPCSSTAIPAAEASQWVEATIPKVPRSSGRVVNTPRGYVSGTNQTAPSGGSVTGAENGWSCHGTASASTEPRFPTPEPP